MNAPAQKRRAAQAQQPRAVTHAWGLLRTPRPPQTVGKTGGAGGGGVPGAAGVRSTGEVHAGTAHENVCSWGVAAAVHPRATTTTVTPPTGDHCSLHGVATLTNAMRQNLCTGPPYIQEPAQPQVNQHGIAPDCARVRSRHKPGPREAMQPPGGGCRSPSVNSPPSNHRLSLGTLCTLVVHRLAFIPRAQSVRYVWRDTH